MASPALLRRGAASTTAYTAARTSPTGYGVYSDGNAHVAGNLDVSGAITATTKDFKIDHPLDPAQKFLSHSCVESDDRRTVYDGEVTLDAKGEATVTLPAWFETLNKSFRYQLTAIGPTDRILYVKSGGQRTTPSPSAAPPDRGSTGRSPASARTPTPRPIP